MFKNNEQPEILNTATRRSMERTGPDPNTRLEVEMAYDEAGIYRRDGQDYLEMTFYVVGIAMLLYLAAFGLTFKLTVDGRSVLVHTTLANEF